jgi:hypothetical protein
MAEILNPSRNANATRQAAMWTARQNHKATAIIQALPQWQSGIDVSAVGLYCQSFGNAYVSVDTGTTGATAPSGTAGNVADGDSGSVTWQFVSPKTMLQFLFVGPPTI